MGSERGGRGRGRREGGGREGRGGTRTKEENWEERVKPGR